MMERRQRVARLVAYLLLVALMTWLGFKFMPRLVGRRHSTMTLEERR